MADTLLIACPECSKEFKVPATAAGKKVRCKACGEVIPITAGPVAAKAPPAGKPPAKTSPAAAKPAPKPDDDLDGDGKPYGVTATDLSPRCPECANDMGEGDVVCLKCGYNTSTRQRVGTKKTVDITGMDVFLWLLPGILCVLFIIGLIVWDILYLLLANRWFPNDGDLWFLASGFVKLWQTLISIFAMVGMAKFAVKRLIQHPSPPEVEIRG